MTHSNHVQLFFEHLNAELLNQLISQERDISGQNRNPPYIFHCWHCFGINLSQTSTVARSSCVTEMKWHWFFVPYYCCGMSGCVLSTGLRQIQDLVSSSCVHLLT